MNQLLISGEGNFRYPGIYPVEIIDKKISLENRKPERQLFNQRPIFGQGVLHVKTGFIERGPFRAPRPTRAAWNSPLWVKKGGFPYQECVSSFATV